MDVAFHAEPFTRKLYAELLPCLQDHWREVAHFPDIELEPDVDRYLAAQGAGVLRIFTVRAEMPPWAQDTDPRPLVVGYCAFFVQPNPHYRQSLQAAADVLFLARTVRAANALRFLKWCDEQLRAEGVQAVYHRTKVAHDFGKLLERMRYTAVDVTYVRRLDSRELTPLEDPGITLAIPETR
ncbi:MAG TPA: hypothetical protein VF787_03230 [Thermoanaerobaculia bacterium]